MKKQKPRDRIVQSAIETIANRGMAGFEIRKLASLAETSPDRFYAYFQCRDDLLIEVFDKGWQLILKCVGEELLLAGGTIEEKPSAVIRGVFRAFDEDRDLIEATVVIGMTTVGWPIRERLRESGSFRTFLSGLAGIERQIGPEIGMADDAVVLSQFFMGGVMRLLFLMTPLGSKGDEWQSKQRRELMLKTIEKLLKGVFQNNNAPDEYIPGITGGL